MTRLLVLPAIALALALSGCISPDMLQKEAAKHQEAPQPPPQRIDGMTAEVTKVDKVVDCNTGGNLQIPPSFCAERTLVATGEIGVESLPVDLWGNNGAITLTGTPGDGDAWSFTAVYRVRATTADEAKKGLDTAWSWRHETGGKHVLEAGPNASVPLVGPNVDYAKYQLVVPEWILLDVQAATTNGAITLANLHTSKADLKTTNGAIAIEALVKDVTASTTNGGIAAKLTPDETGRVALHTTNGAIAVEIPETSAHGYAIDAQTTNGRIKLDLQDGEHGGEKTHQTFKTNSYDQRDIQTDLAIGTTNGGVEVAGA